MKILHLGPPSSGKTSVLEYLAAKGHVVSPEAARLIIQREQQREQRDPSYKPIVPWTDFDGFQDDLMHEMIGLERLVAHHPVVHVDRGLPDCIIYPRVKGREPPKGIYEHIMRADYKRVFVYDSVGFVDDAQRKDRELSDMIAAETLRVVPELGHTPIRVPVFSEDKETNIRLRAEYVLAHCGLRANTETERKYAASHAAVRAALIAHPHERYGPIVQTDRYYDPGNALARRGMTLRLRNEDGRYAVTLKGPKEYDESRFEWEPAIPRWLGTLLERIPASTVVSKQRTEYHPLTGGGTKIALDTVAGLGEFAEIEGPTRFHLEDWSQRLGLSNPVKEGYKDLAQRNAS